jgi:hypothetical protein
VRAAQDGLEDLDPLLLAERERFDARVRVDLEARSAAPPR